ncbi:hypothetical protein GEMRC1_002897 [Eukaryota sp. GEM-RC1]
MKENCFLNNESTTFTKKSGLGVFADENIPSGRVVLSYIGKYRCQNNKPIHPLFIEDAWMLTDGTVIDAEEDDFNFGVANFNKVISVDKAAHTISELLELINFPSGSSRS